VRVTWKDQVISDAMFEDFYQDKDFNPDDQFIQRYGEVLGVSRGFFGNTYLTVACEDGKIRTIEEDNVTTCTI
jgi:hypothetical protein